MTAKYDLRLSEDAFKQNFRNVQEIAEDAVLRSGGASGSQAVTGDISVTGKIGIGDSTPDFDLDIQKTTNGSVRANVQNDSTGTSADARVPVMAATSSVHLIAFGSGYSAATLYGLASLASWQTLSSLAGNGLVLGTVPATPLVFGTTNLERARIEADGTVKLYQTQRTTATFTKAADTTLAAVTGLSFTVAAGRSYRFIAELHIDAPAAGGYKLAVGGTATATSYIAWLEVTSNTPAVTLASRSTTFGAGAGLTGAITGRALLSGTIQVNVGGSLAPLFAQNAASGASTVAIGSSFQIWPI